MNVVDSALITINASNGIEVCTETMWENATKLGIPKMLVVNGLDRDHTKFDDILTLAKKRFGENVFPMQIPMDP